MLYWWDASDIELRQIHRIHDVRFIARTNSLYDISFCSTVARTRSFHVNNKPVGYSWTNTPRLVHRFNEPVWTSILCSKPSRSHWVIQTVSSDTVALRLTAGDAEVVRSVTFVITQRHVTWRLLRAWNHDHRNTSHQCFPSPKWGASCSWWRTAERAVGRASREGARRNVCPDAPIKNYTIKHQYVDCQQFKTNNKICIIACKVRGGRKKERGGPPRRLHTRRNTASHDNIS